MFDHGIVQIILQVFQMVYAVCIWFFLSHLFDIDLLVMQFILTFFASLCGVSVILYSLVHLVLDALICGVDVLCDAFREVSLKVSAQSTSLAYKLGKDDRREVGDDIDETTPTPPISTSFATIPLPTTLFTRRWEFPACASINNFEFAIDFDISKDNKDEKEEKILPLKSIDTAPRNRKSLMSSIKIRHRLKKTQSAESDCRRVRNELCNDNATTPTMLPLKTILRERNNWGRITQRHSKNKVRFDDSANEMKTYEVEEGHTMRPYRERKLSTTEEETQTMKSGPAKRKRVMDLVLEESSPSLKRMRISEFDISKDGLNDDGRVGDGNSNVEVEEEAQTTSSGPRKRKRPMDLLLEEASPTTNAKRHCRRVGNELSTDDESAPTLEFHFDSEDDESNDDDGRVGLDANNNVEEEEAQPMQTRRRKRKRAIDLLLEEASAFTKASLLGFGAGSTISSSGQRRSLRLAQQSQINVGSGHNARGRYSLRVRNREQALAQASQKRKKPRRQRRKQPKSTAAAKPFKTSAVAAVCRMPRDEDQDLGLCDGSMRVVVMEEMA